MSVAQSLGSLFRCPIYTASDHRYDVSKIVHHSRELQLQASTRTRTEAKHYAITHVGGNSYGIAGDAMHTKS